MRPARIVLALVVALLIASPVLAAKKATKSNIPYYQTLDKTLAPVTLTDDQTSKLNDLKKEYEQKLKDAYAQEDVLTPEQKTARDDAKKAAKTAGKTTKEVTAAGNAAVTLTDDQQKQKKAAHKALLALQKEIRGKVMDLLTPEQKTQVDATKGAKSKKPADPTTPAATPAPAAPATTPAPAAPAATK